MVVVVVVLFVCLRVLVCLREFSLWELFLYWPIRAIVKDQVLKTYNLFLNEKNITKRMEGKEDNYIEDTTRWREDMNFIFEWQNNILRTSAASE